MTKRAERLSTGQAATYLGFSTQTLRRWAREGRLRHTVTPSGRMLFRREDLDAAFREVELTQAASG